jgi:hypothetical protein
MKTDKRNMQLTRDNYGVVLLNYQGKAIALQTGSLLDEYGFYHIDDDRTFVVAIRSSLSYISGAIVNLSSAEVEQSGFICDDWAIADCLQIEESKIWQYSTSFIADKLYAYMSQL